MLTVRGGQTRKELAVFVEELPFISVESVLFHWPEGAGVVAPVSFNGGTELCITIGSVRSFEILVLAIEHFGAVARFKLRDSVVRLHHALFCPVYSPGGPCRKRLFPVCFGV